MVYRYTKRCVFTPISLIRFLLFCISLKGDPYAKMIRFKVLFVDCPKLLWELGGGYSQSQYVVIVQDLRVLVLASSILLG